MLIGMCGDKGVDLFDGVHQLEVGILRWELELKYQSIELVNQLRQIWIGKTFMNAKYESNK
jgi:hypothetical protein